MDKNKQYMIEAVVGLIVLITLIIFAVWLLIRKGDTHRAADGGVVTESLTEDAIEQTVADDTGKTGATDSSDTVKGIDLNEENRKNNAAAAANGQAEAELPQVYTPGEPMEWTEDNYQLPELYTCWDAYELEAVTDLINLERVRRITDSLKGSDNYYYYGNTDASGNPDGKGLAVYAGNTYYFGDWKAGKREGDGMWIRIFPDKPGTLNGITGVTWHQYSGKWANDYPNGQGQENVQYDTELMNRSGEIYAVQNAIGGFKNGLYHGDMYIMTNNGYGSTTDWYGTAKDGVFTYLNDKKGYNGKRAIWQAGEGYETGEEDNCRWILPADNADYGIAGLKKK